MTIRVAGWYPDPPGERYWDGTRWTEYRALPTPLQHQPEVHSSTWATTPVTERSGTSGTWWSRHRPAIVLVVGLISVAAVLTVAGLIYVFNFSPWAEHRDCVEHFGSFGSYDPTAELTCDRFMPDTGFF